MKTIGVGVIGTAFMGKAHSIAYAAAGSVFGDGLHARRRAILPSQQRGAAAREYGQVLYR